MTVHRSAIENWRTKQREALERKRAAAPEMYEALKDVEWAAQGFCPQCAKSRDCGHQATCILGNALAKANGGAA